MRPCFIYGQIKEQVSIYTTDKYTSIYIYIISLASEWQNVTKQRFTNTIPIPNTNSNPNPNPYPNLTLLQVCFQTNLEENIFDEMSFWGQRNNFFPQSITYFQLRTQGYSAKFQIEKDIASVWGHKMENTDSH